MNIVIFWASNPKFYPSISFNKKSSIFSLYFYPQKDSLIQKVSFFYDGGSILPDLSYFDSEFIDLICKYFSFNITNLKKAIHSKAKRKIYLKPRSALIGKDFLNIHQSRSHHSKQPFDFAALLEQQPHLLSFIHSAASSYDLSIFNQFYIEVKSILKSKTPSFDSLFAFFKNYVLDLQR